ncbi:MAG: glycerate kinase [Planctomycetota bacterium]
MKIVIAPDSFKESLSALDAARAIEAGVLRAAPGARTEVIPMADGGEGTVDALVAATGGRREKVRVTGPLGEPVEAAFGILADRQTAVIEMAAASGLPLVPLDRRNPLVTTTFGTGELIRAAFDLGARRFILGIGGSATVDGGTGMASALGVRFLDKAGRALAPGGGSLVSLAWIDASARDARAAQADFRVATDVDNPLTGPHGAAAVFGPQKGADPEMVEKLDRGLARLAEVIRRDLGTDVENLPGAGAAGGLGAGFVAFLGAKLSPGVELVLDAVDFRARVRDADLVITGEGRLDGTSARGKTPVGVARAAKEFGVPVVALAGSVASDARAVHDLGIDAAFAIVNAPMTLAQAMEGARELLAFAGEQATRLFVAGRVGARKESGR